MRDAVQRMRELEHRVHDAQTVEREEIAGAVAYLNRELPRVWDLNFMRIDGNDADPVTEAERLYAGYGHRKLLIEDPRLVRRFAPVLRERGYGQRGLTALARRPGGELDPDVREMSFDEVQDLALRIVGEQAPGRDPEVNRQVTQAGRLRERAGARWLVIFDGDNPVGHCMLFSHAGVAQIDDVATLRSHQRRGLSRRLLHHALERVAADHDLVFILAESDDWPVAFYGRLGFEEVERRSDFLLVIAEP
jgi:ribosomal protein S18 acetylase RimI-like enzyme